MTNKKSEQTIRALIELLYKTFEIIITIHMHIKNKKISSQWTIVVNDDDDDDDNDDDAMTMMKKDNNIPDIRLIFY